MSKDDFEFKGDKYAEVYGEEYTKKMLYLRRVIFEYETDEDEFNVLNFEAGLGVNGHVKISINGQQKSAVNWK